MRGEEYLKRASVGLGSSINRGLSRLDAMAAAEAWSPDLKKSGLRRVAATKRGPPEGISDDAEQNKTLNSNGKKGEDAAAKAGSWGTEGLAGNRKFPGRAAICCTTMGSAGNAGPETGPLCGDHRR